jgi:hypothetical protein
MTPASNERRLAGRWVVWWWHESHAVVDAADVIVARQYRKIWRYGQAKIKAGDTLWTKARERVPARDAYVVNEIPDWPREDGGYKPLTDAQFNELIARGQP